MNFLNRKRTIVKLTSYFCYLYAGSTVTVSGVLIPPSSAYFNVKSGTIGYIITLLYLGMFLASLVGGFLLHKYHLKNLLFSIYLVTLISVCYFVVMPCIINYSICTFMLGFSCGFFMTLGNYLITNEFKNSEDRSSKLVFADFFFCFAGIIVPLAVAVILKLNIQWFYIFFLIILLGFFAVLLGIKFDNYGYESTKKETVVKTDEKKNWNIVIYLIGFSLLFYTIGEYVFSTWFPDYTVQILNWSMEKASIYLSIFWLAMSTGLFIGHFIIKKVPIKIFIMSAMVFSLILIILISNMKNNFVILAGIVLFGCVTSVIYSALVSYCSFQIDGACPYLMSFMMIAVSLGTIISTSIGGVIEKKIGIQWTLNLSCIAYALCMFLFIFCFLYKKKSLSTN